MATLIVTIMVLCRMSSVISSTLTPQKPISPAISPTIYPTISPTIYPTISQAISPVLSPASSFPPVTTSTITGYISTSSTSSPSSSSTWSSSSSSSTFDPNSAFTSESSFTVQPSDRMSVEVRVGLVALYTLTALAATLGNLLVIVVFAVGKRSRTDLRDFLINLAVADLMMAIFCMPFTFTATMMNSWVFGAFTCPLVLYIQTLSVTASVCTNMAVGVDRFWVVVFPMKSRITKSKSRLTISLIWLVSGLLSSVQLVVARTSVDPLHPGYRVECAERWPQPQQLWRRLYTLFIFGVTYLLPLVCLTLAYGTVACRLWRRTAPGNADVARDAQQMRSKLKVVKMLAVVVFLFGLCWLPLHAFMLILDFYPSLVQNYGHLLTPTYFSVHWLAMSNSFVNPIVYSFLNERFRVDMRQILAYWLPCVRGISGGSNEASRVSMITGNRDHHQAKRAPATYRTHATRGAVTRLSRDSDNEAGHVTHAIETSWSAEARSCSHKLLSS